MNQTETDTRAKLIGDVQNFITKFVFLPNDDAALIISLWVMHTWAADQARATPYLYIHSPEKQSGKTKLMDVLSTLVRNPMTGASMTGSVLFRSIQSFHPTLLLDEVDGIFSGAKNEEMRCALNSGYKREGCVWRVSKGEPARYMTYCPKLLAGINNGKLPDTIADRAIPIRMRRKPKSEMTEPFYMSDVQTSREYENLMARIENWVKAHGDSLFVARPKPIEEISDRKWEISEALIAIAEKMGIGDEARTALINVLAENDEGEGLSPQQELLIEIRSAFGDYDRIMTAALVEHLDDDWNGKRLGVVLKPYGIAPQQIRVGNQTGKGYMRRQFESAWESYL